MNFYFDMDGTIANLYGVKQWLPMLHSSNPTPYRIAKPILPQRKFSALLRSLKAKGHNLYIITWGSKDATLEFDKAVEETKRQWVQKYCPEITDIIFLHYGEPKHKHIVNHQQKNILFDDNREVRLAWESQKLRHRVAYTEKDILPILTYFATT